MIRAASQVSSAVMPVGALLWQAAGLRLDKSARAWWR